MVLVENLRVLCQRLNYVEGRASELFLLFVVGGGRLNNLSKHFNHLRFDDLLFEAARGDHFLQSQD